MSSRHHVLAALALTCAAAMTACGADEAPAAEDPTAVTTTGEPTPTATAPTLRPRPGSLPDFPYTDYAYTLQVTCFCGDVDQKYRIEVASGAVTGVTWATPGRDHEVGDPVTEDYWRITIQDIIDKGNEPDAYKVEVGWPPDQAWPNRIYIDRDANMADEEVGYLISDVVTV